MKESVFVFEEKGPKDCMESNSGQHCNFYPPSVVFGKAESICFSSFALVCVVHLQDIFTLNTYFFAASDKERISQKFLIF